MIVFSSSIAGVGKIASAPSHFQDSIFCVSASDEGDFDTFGMICNGISF
jgi:hypothetical protein